MNGGGGGGGVGSYRDVAALHHGNFHAFKEEAVVTKDRI